MSEPGASPAKGKFEIVCESFHSVRRAALRGYATIVIRDLRLRISDVAIYQREDGQRWAQLPTKVKIRNGEVVKDDHGKQDYIKILEFTDPQWSRAFSKRVVEVVDEFEPLAFAPDTPDDEAAA